MVVFILESVPTVLRGELTRWLNLPPGTFALPAVQPKKPDPKDEEKD